MYIHVPGPGLPACMDGDALTPSALEQDRYIPRHGDHAEQLPSALPILATDPFRGHHSVSSVRRWTVPGRTECRAAVSPTTSKRQ
jgi:hypothetical protein